MIKTIQLNYHCSVGQEKFIYISALIYIIYVDNTNLPFPLTNFLNDIVKNSQVYNTLKQRNYSVK